MFPARRRLEKRRSRCFPLDNWREIDLPKKTKRSGSSRRLADAAFIYRSIWCSSAECWKQIHETSHFWPVAAVVRRRHYRSCRRPSTSQTRRCRCSQEDCKTRVRWVAPVVFTYTSSKEANELTLPINKITRTWRLSSDSIPRAIERLLISNRKTIINRILYVFKKHLT